jgi:hypothetical protein
MRVKGALRRALKRSVCADLKRVLQALFMLGAL